MTIFLFAAFGHAVLKLLLGAVAVFLILLVLVQRGRGGGLAGALGGMGGSSAFGAKAGDVFTRITIVAAAVWIFLCIAAAKLGPSEDSLIKTNTAVSTSTDGPSLISAGEADPSEAEVASEGGAADEASSDADGVDSTSSDPSQQE